MEMNLLLDLDRAYDTMGMHIQGMVNKLGLKVPEDFAFIKMQHFEKEFADMVFRYKNQIYAILMDVTSDKNHISLETDKVERFTKVAKQNNLIPCIFPITLEFKPINGEHGWGIYLAENEIPRDTEYSVKNPKTWNLINIETNELVNPVELSSDAPIEMSDYELGNFSILVAMQELSQRGFGVDVVSDMPDCYPQILFKTKEGQEGWCAVVYSTKYDTEQTEEYQKVFERNSKLHNLAKDTAFGRFVGTHIGILFCVYVKNSLRTGMEHGYKYKYMPLTEIKG